MKENEKLPLIIANTKVEIRVIGGLKLIRRQK